VKGIASASDIFQFARERHTYIDVRAQRLRGNAISLPWKKPKLLANAVRRSRGAWCLAASIDRKGSVASQQLFGVWPTQLDVPLEVLASIVNGPIANAYSRDHSTDARLLVSALENIPIPVQLPNDVVGLVHAYTAIVSDQTLLIGPSDEQKNALLNQIDAMVLKAYDLPPRLEKMLLEQFRDTERPTLHLWAHWFPRDFQSFIPLHEYYSDEYRKSKNNWPLKVFVPLPESEATALSQALE
jgi:hypothetical protein